MLRSRVLSYGERPCLLFKRNGVSQTLSWDELHEQILDLAGTFLSLGLQKGDRVAILSENRPEWVITDFAILSIGCVTVPIYHTLTPSEIQYLLEDSGARCLFVSHPSFSENLSRWKGQTFYFEEPGFSNILGEGKRYREKEPELFRSRVETASPQDTVTIIYTSGTTGEPKGVMLSHENFLSNCRSCSTVIPVSEKDRYLSFLPLSHAFERMAGCYFILFRGARIIYAESLEKVFENMQEFHPTLMSGVPRFFEKFQEGILTAVSKKSAPLQKIFLWAIRAGRTWARNRQEKKTPCWLDAVRYGIASLFLRPLRHRIGKNMKFFISGSAPLSLESIEFFAGIGFTILEGYGLTETSPVISANTPDRIRWGSVGPVIPGVEVKTAEDGEILVRGPNVMQGYFKREEETRNVFREGYFLTGDIGHLDEEGFLILTDRKKDLIKTSGGKFVSPQKIEALLKKDPMIQEAVVFGDKRKYVVALLVPRFEPLKKLAALSRSEIISFFQDRVDTCLKEVSSFERVKRIALLDKELTQKEGDLTPTLKIKRRLVYEKYKDLIEALYEEVTQNKH